MSADEPPEQGQEGVPVPPPLDDRDAALDASIRMKLDRGERLDEEERAFLARLPGDKEVMPGDIPRG